MEANDMINDHNRMRKIWNTETYTGVVFLTHWYQVQLTLNSSSQQLETYMIDQKWVWPHNRIFVGAVHWPSWHCYCSYFGLCSKTRGEDSYDPPSPPQPEESTPPQQARLPLGSNWLAHLAGWLPNQGDLRVQPAGGGGGQGSLCVPSEPRQAERPHMVSPTVHIGTVGRYVDLLYAICWFIA